MAGMGGGGRLALLSDAEGGSLPSYCEERLLSGD